MPFTKTVVAGRKTARYTLTGEGLQSDTVFLNSSLLKTQPDGSVGELIPIETDNGRIVLPPASSTFVVDYSSARRNRLTMTTGEPLVWSRQAQSRQRRCQRRLWRGKTSHTQCGVKHLGSAPALGSAARY